MTRSWKPRLSADGKTFCSPACEGGCTRADYEKTVRRTNALAKRLGDAWKPKVWENLGWFGKVVHSSGHMDVGLGIGLYHAYISRNLRAGGGSWCGTGETPTQAIDEAITKLENELVSMTRIIGLISQAKSSKKKRKR